MRCCGTAAAEHVAGAASGSSKSVVIDGVRAKSHGVRTMIAA